MAQLNAATRLTASAAEDKKYVIRFCKEFHIDLNSTLNIPLLSKGPDAHLMETCDNWAEARKFLNKQYADYQNSGKKGPWLA